MSKNPVPELPRCDSRAIDESDFSLLKQWAIARDQPVTVFDLESTTFAPSFKSFGITEVALLQLYPDRPSMTCTALVDPKRRIPPDVVKLTGITNDDVKGQPTWAAWSAYLDYIARAHLTAGYCSFGFDCPAVVGQNTRYGLEGTSFETHLDIYGLPGVSGKLVDAAAAYGVVSDTYHRALADVMVTARLLEKVAAELGLERLDQFIGIRPGGGSGNYSPRSIREQELLEHLDAAGELPDLDEFAAGHNIKRSTAEGDVLRLAEKGLCDDSLLARGLVQDWLQGRLDEAIRQCWVGEQEGRLKPLMELLSPDAPEGLDYTQLRLALRRRG